MKVPKTLLIGEYEWTIKFVKKVPCEGTDIFGLCDPSDRVIYIRTKLSYEDRANTLAHEILHALGYEHGFYEMPHKLVYKIADAFTKLYLDNF